MARESYIDTKDDTTRTLSQTLLLFLIITAFLINLILIVYCLYTLMKWVARANCVRSGGIPLSDVQKIGSMTESNVQKPPSITLSRK